MPILLNKKAPKCGTFYGKNALSLTENHLHGETFESKLQINYDQQIILRHLPHVNLGDLKNLLDIIYTQFTFYLMLRMS